MRTQESSTQPKRYALDPRLQVFTGKGGTVWINGHQGVSSHPGIDGRMLGELLKTISAHEEIERTREWVGEDPAKQALLSRLLKAEVIRVEDGPPWVGNLESSLPGLGLPFGKDIARATVLVGSSAFADALHGFLPQRSSIEHFKSAMRPAGQQATDGKIIFSHSHRDSRAASPIGKEIDPSSLVEALRGKRFAILVLERTPVQNLMDLFQAASDADVFVLPVEAVTDEEIVIGPLIPPKSGEWLSEVLIKKVRESDSSALALLTRGRPFSNSGMIKRVAKTVTSLLALPSMPLLWCRIALHPDGERVEPLETKKISVIRSGSEHLGIQRFLRPDLAGDSELEDKIGSSLRAGSLVSLQDAFLPEFAQTVWESLDSCNSWQIVEKADRDFHYRHHSISTSAKFPMAVLTCALIFNSRKTQEWIKRLGGRNCDLPTATLASRFMPGDYALPHSDSEGKREAAFVWHLTKDWNPEWGGHLVWVPNGARIRPSYNTLHLFNVTGDGLHSVSTVSPSATGKRLAVNGWWCGTSSQREPTKRRRRESLDSNNTVHAYPGW